MKTSFRAVVQRLRRPGRRAVRRVLLVGVPLLAAVIAGALYLLGGRYEDTENAYVQASMTQVAPDVSGRVTEIDVTENQPVKAGDVLLRIDPEPYQLALDRAEAELGNARNDIETLKAQYREQQAQIDLARTDADFAQRELARQEKLAKRGLTSPSDLDRYRNQRDHAVQHVHALEAELSRIRASLGGNPDIAVTDDPKYRDAKAARDQAALDLAHTAVRAPLDGIASKVPDPGTYAAAGKPLLSVVEADHTWVEANFKETQLTHMAPGQDVEVTIDAYPGRTWHGHVQSIAQATGSEFSVLPPQNATGNWVKVVQRVPVRIALDAEPGQPPLRAGLSVSASVDTGNHPRGPAFLAPAVAWLRDTLLPTPARADGGR